MLGKIGKLTLHSTSPNLPIPHLCFLFLIETTWQHFSCYRVVFPNLDAVHMIDSTSYSSPTPIIFVKGNFVLLLSYPHQHKKISHSQNLNANRIHNVSISKILQHFICECFIILYNRTLSCELQYIEHGHMRPRFSVYV